MFIYLYRRDFKNLSDGESTFDCILFDLKIPKEKWEDIEEIEIKVEKFEIIE